MSSTISTERELLRPLHERPAGITGHLLAGGAYLTLVALSILAWESGYWGVNVLLWIALAWMGHAALTRLHESAHRMLFRSRIANELAGISIGTISLTPLSVYRYLHTQHHKHLGGECDPEFWPYNLPTATRLRRISYAWSELLAGGLFTPMLYSLRTARAWNSLSLGMRQRLLNEWLVLATFWAVLLFLTQTFHAWGWLWAGHLAPAWIAGSMQTVRKFTEHLGRFGETIPDMTRTVVYQGPIGRAASHSQLHVEHHGTHHRRPGIPYHNLPKATPIVYGLDWQRRTFPTHWSAICEMLPWLLDPCLGPQWGKRLPQA